MVFIVILNDYLTIYVKEVLILPPKGWKKDMSLLKDEALPIWLTSRKDVKNFTARQQDRFLRLMMKTWNFSKVALSMGYYPTDLRDYCKDNKVFLLQLDQVEQIYLDAIEERLFDDARNGNANTAVAQRIFALKTRRNHKFQEVRRVDKTNKVNITARLESVNLIVSRLQGENLPELDPQQHKRIETVTPKE